MMLNLNGKYSMLPSFEIYLSILTDDLMPWLKENRRQEKFESVIRKAGPEFHGDYKAFFDAVANSFKIFHVDAPKKINAELELLAKTTLTALGKRLIETFVNQPVLNYREHFYNVITGMSLGAYHDLTEHYLRKCEGPEIKAFYLEKLLADIHSILLLPLPGEFETPEEEKIAVRIKLALAILYTLLQKKQGKIENSMLLYFDTRGWLKKILDQMESDDCKEEFLTLFDRFAGDKKSPEQRNPEVKPDQKETMETGSYTTILNEFMAFQQELIEVKQNVTDIALNITTPNKVNSAEKWLTSPEVCDLLKIGKSTLQRWRKSNKVKTFKLAGKYRYLEQDIQNLMRANGSNF